MQGMHRAPCVVHTPSAAALGHDQFADREHTARRMHQQTQAFARRFAASYGWGFTDSRTEKIKSCVENSVRIMNEAAGTDWGDLFTLQLREADSADAERGASTTETDLRFTLEFCGLVDEDPDSESISGLKPAMTVASRLNLEIASGEEHTLLVHMEAGNTIICLRCMHLATLLRACALLIAQQLACLCIHGETVALSGICQARETKRIYARIFHSFDTDDLHRDGDECIGTLRNSGAQHVPRSLVTVANILWMWHDTSAFMFHEALPAQIRRYAARAEKGASVPGARNPQEQRAVDPLPAHRVTARSYPVLTAQARVPATARRTRASARRQAPAHIPWAVQ